MKALKRLILITALILIISTSSFRSIYGELNGN